MESGSPGVTSSVKSSETESTKSYERFCKPVGNMVKRKRGGRVYLRVHPKGKQGTRVKGITVPSRITLVSCSNKEESVK